MGKKSKILYYTVLFVNLACFLLSLLPINFPFFRISFAVTLILIGLLLVARAMNYKIDSSMFFGVALFGFGVINMVLYFADFETKQYWPYYLFTLALASIITGLYFKDKLQLKLFMLFLGFGLISLLFVQSLISLVWFIVLMVVWFVGYFIVNSIIFKRKRR